MDSDFLQRIREAEAQADAQCAEARDKGRAMEQAAAQRAKAILEEREQEAYAARDAILKDAAERAQRGVKNQHAELNITLNTLRQQTKARTETAVSYIVEKVVNA